MDINKLFEEGEGLIKEILIILNVIQIELRKKGYGSQRSFDLVNGLVYKGGLVVPYNSIKHKIMFDGYEDALLDVYIDLYKKMFEKWNDTFAQFAIRTLEEIGIEKFQILFDKTITKNEKDKYKLLLMLADFGSLADKDNYKQDYKKLLNEYKKLLFQKEFIFYDKLIEEFRKKTPIQKAKIVKAARVKINQLHSDLFKKTKLLPLFKEINIYSSNSTFSHILHGNVLLLKQVLQSSNSNVQKLRIYWSLILTGINVINFVGNYLNIPKLNDRIKKINEDFKKFSIDIEKNWEKI